MACTHKSGSVPELVSAFTPKARQLLRGSRMTRMGQKAPSPASRVWSGANTQTLEEGEILLTVGRPILAWNKQEKLIEGRFNLHNEPDGLGRSRFAVDSIVAVESAAIPAGASKLKLSSWFFTAESCGQRRSSRHNSCDFYCCFGRHLSTCSLE